MLKDVEVGSFLETRVKDRMLVCSKLTIGKLMIIEGYYVFGPNEGKRFLFNVLVDGLENTKRERTKCDEDIVRIASDFNFTNILWQSDDYLECDKEQEEVEILTPEEEEFLEEITMICPFAYLVKENDKLYLLDNKKETLISIYISKTKLNFEGLEEKELYERED